MLVFLIKANAKRNYYAVIEMWRACTYIVRNTYVETDTTPNYLRDTQ